MPENIPTLAEFDRCCRDEFQFLMEDFGFLPQPGSTEHERFCVRFIKENRSIEIRGEGYGKTAACHISEGENGPLSLICLVPEAARPKRYKKRDRMGQLEHIREWAQLAREHAADFFAGDMLRFRREWDSWRKMLAAIGTQPSAQKPR